MDDTFDAEGGLHEAVRGKQLLVEKGRELLLDGPNDVGRDLGYLIAGRAHGPVVEEEEVDESAGSLPSWLEDLRPSGRPDNSAVEMKRLNPKKTTATVSASAICVLEAASWATATMTMTMTAQGQEFVIGAEASHVDR